MSAEQEHAKAIAESWAETEHEPRVSDNDNDVVLARGYLALATELLAAQEREKALREALRKGMIDYGDRGAIHVVEEILAGSLSEKASKDAEGAKP